MYRISLALMFGMLTGGSIFSSAMAQSPGEVEAVECIEFINTDAGPGTFFKGKIQNRCIDPITVTFGFDKNLDGTAKPGPWCASGLGSTTLDPGESEPVAAFDHGVRFNIYWSSCVIKTDNHFPLVRYIEDGSCDYTCE